MFAWQNALQDTRQRPYGAELHLSKAGGRRSTDCARLSVDTAETVLVTSSSPPLQLMRGGNVGQAGIQNRHHRRFRCRWAVHMHTLVIKPPLHQQLLWP